MNLQVQYKLALAERETAEELNAIRLIAMARWRHCHPEAPLNRDASGWRSICWTCLSTHYLALKEAGANVRV